MKNSVILRILPVIITVVFFTAGCEKDKSGLPVDGDGNVYDTVVIGTQVWLKENLKTTKYNNGTSIYLVTDDVKWSEFQTGAYCWYNNNPDYKNTYGALYSWQAVKTGMLCPKGWKVPSLDDWETLIKTVGWNYYGVSPGNESGIKSLEISSNISSDRTEIYFPPGGYRGWNGVFYRIGYIGCYWIDDKRNINIIDYSYPKLSASVGESGGNPGFSVRCIKK